VEVMALCEGFVTLSGGRHLPAPFHGDNC
jgi:hypothetical protein